MGLKPRSGVGLGEGIFVALILLQAPYIETSRFTSASPESIRSPFVFRGRSGVLREVWFLRIALHVSSFPAAFGGFELYRIVSKRCNPAEERIA